MNINICTTNSGIKKQVFIPTLYRKHGLILQVYHTIRSSEKQQKVRFIHANFDKSGNILAVGDQAGNIFLIDILKNKFWALPTTISCTTLKFSIFNNVELLVGRGNGNVSIINVESAETTGELLSHKQAVTDICFSHDYMCLTSSKYEAILWDLRLNSKVQVLNISSENQLKLISFMPITSNILACFDDDAVVVWKYQSFEMFQEISQAQPNGHPLRSVAFSRNGRVMVFGGYFPYLTVFALDTWSEISSINLPAYIFAIKRIEFIPQLFDGGSNKILGILASNGALYFYDIEQCVIVNKVIVNEEVIKFDCSYDGQYIACTLKSGEVNIYKITHYVPSRNSFEPVRRRSYRTNTASETARRSASLLNIIQRQIKEVLDIDKLRAILTEFGRYPDSYRLKIWCQMLDLPNNFQQYNTFINISSQTVFEDLEKTYPLENKTALRNLKKLLANLITWSPFFAQVSYLPVFVFPFVKVFQNEPVLLFEAVCTIIVNWCQHWFEYFPLPPINVLAMVENLLLEHDPELLNLFTNLNVTSKLYAWPLLESAFSEVLTPTDWCRLWDHILTNEPSFLLMCIAAYSILHRQVLSKMNEPRDFEIFYHNQNVIDIKRLITKSYALLSNTTNKCHPRQYLLPFTKIEPGSYPHFLGFPKVLVDIEYSELEKLKKEQLEIQKEKEEILKQRELECSEIDSLQKQAEEKNRLKELEKVCRQKIQAERERVKDQRNRLVELRKRLYQEEVALLNKSREQIVEKNINERRLALERILFEVEENRTAEEIEVIKAESDMVKHYSELLHHKIHLEEALNAEKTFLGPSLEHTMLKKQQQLLADELEKIQKSSHSKDNLKQINLATGINALDDLIVRIEIELAKHMAKRYENLTVGQSNIKIVKLEAETKELEMEVSKLLTLLADMKTRETKEKLSELYDSISHKTAPLIPPPHITDSYFRRQQRSYDIKDKVVSIGAFGDDFQKLKQLIKDAKEGYSARPPTPIDEQEENPSEELITITTY